MDINVITNQLILLFLIICLGYILYKIKLMNDDFDKQLTKLLLNVTMPCMVVASVLKVEEKESFSVVITLLLTALVLYAFLMPVIGFIISKLIRVKKKQTGLYVFMTTFSNIGFMGFPVINAVYGQKGLFYAAIFNLVFNLMVYSIGVSMINMGTDRKEKLSLKKLCNPGVILSLLAIIIYFIPVKCPVIISDAVEMVGNITSPAAMLLIGAALAKLDVKSIFNDIRAYPYALIKQVALPLLLYIPIKMIFKDPTMLGVVLILIAMPIANTAVLYATEYDGDEENAARNVFITTVMSLFTIPLVLNICF